MATNSKEYMRKWRESHPEYMKKWRKDNPEKVKEYDAKFSKKASIMNKKTLTHSTLIKYNNKWTEDEMKVLRRLYEKGEDPIVIANLLDRTYKSVTSKMSRLRKENKNGSNEKSNNRIHR